MERRRAQMNRLNASLAPCGEGARLRFAAAGLGGPVKGKRCARHPPIDALKGLELASLRVTTIGGEARAILSRFKSLRLMTLSGDPFSFLSH